MLVPALLMAAIVTIPPPAESNAVKPAFAAFAGLSNPGWGHVGAMGRLGDIGATVSLGTIGLGYDLSLGGRFWLPAPVRGGYVEAGASVVGIAQQSDFTPDDLFVMGYAAAGWQFNFGRWLIDAAIGPPPTSLSDESLLPLVVINAMELPRFKLAVGYAF